MKGRAVAEALPTADVERTHAFDVGLEPLRSLGVTRQRGGPTRGAFAGASAGGVAWRAISGLGGGTWARHTRVHGYQSA